MKYVTLGFLFLTLLPGTSPAQFNPFNSTPFDPSTWSDLDPNNPGSAANHFFYPPQSVTTFDDPTPHPSGRNVLFFVENDTNDTVAFLVPSSVQQRWYTLLPNHWIKVNTFIPFAQTSEVVISQIGGGVRRFTIQSGVPYAFRVNPSTNQIENYYR